MVLAHVAWRWNGQVELCNVVLSKLVHVGGAQQAALAQQHVPTLDRLAYVVANDGLGRDERP